MPGISAKSMRRPSPALPEEDPPADRLEIERLRRDANRAAAAGRTVSIKELT